MKKWRVILILLTAALLFGGCSSNASKSEKQIREIAYQSLGEIDKKSIIDWESAKVEGYKSQTDHTIWGKAESINLKNKDIWRVTFRTKNDGLLGPITVYMDKNSYVILGYDPRE